MPVKHQTSAPFLSFSSHVWLESHRAADKHGLNTGNNFVQKNSAHLATRHVLREHTHHQCNVTVVMTCDISCDAIRFDTIRKETSWVQQLCSFQSSLQCAVLIDARKREEVLIPVCGYGHKHSCAYTL